MNNFYIDNGININAAWEKHIAISTDGVRWETFSKDGLNVIPAIRQANTNSPLTDKVEKCIITLTRTGEEDPAFFFDVDNVANQPTWTAPATIIGKCITAVEDITTWLSSCCGASAPAAATEATLQLVLSAIQNGQDFEAKLVVDDNGNGNTYLEVRIWNPDTQTWETPLYYTAGSNVGIPSGSLTAPIIYINPAALLGTIANNTTGLATQVTLASLLSAFNAEDFATQTTLAALLTELQAKADLTETQPVSLATSVRTPSYDIVTTLGAGSVPAGARSVSIKNNGAVPVTVLGTLLPVGESIGFDAGGQGDTLGAIAYNIPATGSLQIIKTV